MMGGRGNLKGRGALALLLGALVVIVLVVAGTAFGGPPWSDASNSWWVASYGNTDTQAATVADGYPNGTFRPGLPVTRAQFAKMVVDGLGIPKATSGTSSFTDVEPSDYYYPWIEGGAEAGVISGFPDGSFGPNTNVSRQQADSILGSFLAQKELNLRGHIAGHLGNYPSLNTWYLAEGASVLTTYADANHLATVHAPGTAYLIYKGVVQGSYSNGWMYLGPDDELTRSQAVALILRVEGLTFSTALPTVTNLNPSSGLAAGGNSVVITGTNFTDVTSVAFGSTTVVFTVNSSTQITTTAPAGTLGTTVDVTVTTAAGTSATGTTSKYTYGLPTLTSLSPASGPAAGGNTVTITGTNLTGATAVKFGTKAAAFSVVSSTQITATAPSGYAGTTVDVTVTAPGGTTATSVASKYSYGAPTVTAVNPASGPAVGGTTVVITGTGFTGVSYVVFGDRAATSYTVNSPTQITAIAPANYAGTTVDVQVTTYAGTSAISNADKYSYGGPVVTGLSPNVGPPTGGNTVVITGYGFTGVTSVRFGTKSAVAFTVNSTNQITAVAPANYYDTIVDVTVSNASGTSATSSATRYTYGAVSVASVTPNTGSTLGGTQVTITGSGFVSGAVVTFGPGYYATNVDVVDSSTITCTAPAHAAGTVNVVVTTVFGSSYNNGVYDNFTYLAPASTPLFVTLARGLNTPVGSVVNVAIPAGGGIDSTGKVLGWVALTASNISFTVTDAGLAHSTITIDGHSYISGYDYRITYAHTLTIVVTTSETGKANVVRTFLVTVGGPVATAPSAIHLAASVTAGVQGPVTDVVDPYPNSSTDYTGKVNGWMPNTHYNITFTVTHSVAGSETSTITINGVAYTSGTDYPITAASPLTIVVSTTEAGKAPVTRIFVVAVTQTQAASPSSYTLATGGTNGVLGPFTQVHDPGVGGIDYTGAVGGWVSGTNNTIKFHVADAGGTSSITINGNAYTDNSDYAIATASSLSIVVTTTETDMAPVARTFIVSVSMVKATAPSSIDLAIGATNPAFSVTPLGYVAPAEGTNTNGAVSWGPVSHCNIKFTVTDGSVNAHSTITINGGSYLSGNDYKILMTGSLTIVVTTAEANKASVQRTFVVAVTQPHAAAPGAVHLGVGATNPIYTYTDITYTGAEGTNSTGAITGWATSHTNFRFILTPSGTGETSTITINGTPYTSGNDYTVSYPSPISIVVTSTETDMAPVVRTFSVSVAAPLATAPSAFNLTAGSVNGVNGLITNVVDPGPAGGTDSTGVARGWVINTHWSIRFTVTQSGTGSETSTITVDGAPYSNGADLIVGAAPSTLTIVVTTQEYGKTTVVRTFLVSVTP